MGYKGSGNLDIGVGAGNIKANKPISYFGAYSSHNVYTRSVVTDGLGKYARVFSMNTDAGDC